MECVIRAFISKYFRTSSPVSAAAYSPVLGSRDIYIYMRRRCIYWVDDGTNSRSKSRAYEGASVYDMYTYMIYIYTYVY